MQEFEGGFVPPEEEEKINNIEHPQKNPDSVQDFKDKDRERTPQDTEAKHGSWLAEQYREIGRSYPHLLGAIETLGVGVAGMGSAAGITVASYELFGRPEATLAGAVIGTGVFMVILKKGIDAIVKRHFH